MHTKHYLRFTTIALALSTANVAHAYDSKDPLESLNRGIYYFNKVADSLYIKPATTAYELTIPYAVRISVSNWFNNLAVVPTVINGVLQGKIFQALSDTLRFGVNSSLGMFGFFDVATQLGIPAHKEDLGKTFYTWGWKESSYFVYPIVGPSTIRDAIGLTVNLYFSVQTYFKPKFRNDFYVLGTINRRQDLHEIESIIGVAGVEYYSLVRESFYQYREYQLTNGAVINPNDTTPGDNILGEPPD